MDLFCEIACLTERSAKLNGIDLCKKWFKSADKRVPGEALQKFVAYNTDSFDFLEVSPTIIGTDHRASIAFRSSRYIGAIPLRSPDTGKQIGDFVISPRFVGRDRFEDYIEILDLLGDEISPEFVDSLPLASGRNFRPPLYLEAVKYVHALEQLLQRPWRKFDTTYQIRPTPTGQVDWNRYVRYESDAKNRLQFPVRNNVLTEIHSEYRQIRFVFDICAKELASPGTPQRIRNSFRSRLTFIDKRLYFHRPLSASNIPEHASDTPVVRETKRQANKILKRDFVNSTAWRVDFNDVFEKFVQYIFSEVARSMGGKLYANSRILTKSNVYYSWELRSLEPDAIFLADDLIAFIDAKYKSHLYNKFDVSEVLKGDFRADLHQVLAYTSFTNVGKKLGIICYPSNEIEIKSTGLKNPLNDAANQILLVGIPLKRNVIPDAVRTLANRIELAKQNSSSAT